MTNYTIIIISILIDNYFITFYYKNKKELQIVIFNELDQLNFKTYFHIDFS